MVKVPADTKAGRGGGGGGLRGLGRSGKPQRGKKTFKKRCCGLGMGGGGEK